MRLHGDAFGGRGGFAAGVLDGVVKAGGSNKVGRWREGEVACAVVMYAALGDASVDDADVRGGAHAQGGARNVGHGQGLTLGVAVCTA